MVTKQSDIAEADEWYRSIQFRDDLDYGEVLNFAVCQYVEQREIFSAIDVKAMLMFVVTMCVVAVHSAIGESRDFQHSAALCFLLASSASFVLAFVPISREKPMSVHGMFQVIHNEKQFPARMAASLYVAIKGIQHKVDLKSTYLKWGCVSLWCGTVMAMA